MNNEEGLGTGRRCPLAIAVPVVKSCVWRDLGGQFNYAPDHFDRPRL